MDKNDKRLIGIKAIADYLDMSDRNVYYWEKKLGLPLHRIAGGGGYRIYAFKEELDRWQESKEINKLKSKKRNKILWAVSLMIFSLVLTFFFIKVFLNNPSMKPEIISIDANIAYVKNSMGNVLWFFNVKLTNNWMNYIKIDDIDDDGYKEIVACTHNISNDKHFITLFDHNGTILWERTVSTDQKFNNIKIENYFRPGPVVVARSNLHKPLVISKWNHMERFLSIIACHDIHGKLLEQYLHIGNLTDTLILIDLDGDGKEEIVFSGTNNFLNGEGIIGVLPLKGFKGISPPYHIEPEYSHLAYQLKNYIPDEIIHGNQLLYLRFKKTELIPKYSRVYNTTELAYFSKNLIHIRLFPWIIEHEKQIFGIDYIFDSNFKLKEVLAQPKTKQMYPELLKNNDIKIPLEELLDVYSKNVFRWKDGHWVPIQKY